MKKFLLLFLITANSYAGFWCPEAPNEIRFPKPNDGCFEVPNDFDTETAEVSNGKLIINQSKLSIKNARIAANKANADLRAQKISQCETLYSSVDSVSTVPEIRALLKCLVRDAR